MATDKFRVAVLSVVKHDYVPRAWRRTRASSWSSSPTTRAPGLGPRAQPAVRRSVSHSLRPRRGAGMREYEVQVAVVSSEAERHCDLSVRAANAGLHVVQDKPMSTGCGDATGWSRRSSANRVKFLMWNRNFLPAVLHAREQIERRARSAGVYAIHVDFYFAKDAGPPQGLAAARLPAARLAGTSDRAPTSTAPTAAWATSRWASCRSRASIRSATSAC